MSSDVLVKVDRLAQSGEGVVKLGATAFGLADTLPGELVRVRREGASLQLLGVESPSAERVASGCGAFPRCGGCTWQHLSVAGQREARLDTLRRALPAALRGLSIGYTALASRDAWRARARLGWQVVKGQAELGFRARGARELVALSACPVLVPGLNDALPRLRAALGAVSRQGEVSLGLGAEGRAVVSIHPVGAPLATGFAVPEALVAGGFAGAALWVPGASVPATAGDPRPCNEGFDGAPLWLAVDGFGQAHQALNRQLVEAVLRGAEAEGRVVFELHAGAGNFTVALAAAARKMTAVETDEGSVSCLRANLALRGLGGRVAVRQQSAEAAAEAGLRGDVVVLDPPRTGAREVCEALAKNPVRRVVYVSCDPPTLGRDLGLLLGAYEVASIEGFEMFPQTPHLESVVTLVARRGRGGRG